MNRYVDEYFSEFQPESTGGRYQKVIRLHESAGVSWEEVHKMLPQTPRGWFELSRLPSSDRCEFTREHWLSQLPYHPSTHKGLSQFFDSVEDVGVFLLQKTFNDSFSVELVYALSGDRGFFRGKVPKEERAISSLQASLSSILLPEDYVSFLRIHDDFRKASDTGLIPLEAVPFAYQSLQKFLAGQKALTTEKGELINPKSLIPFYESFGMHCYQCFWTDWYPKQEMGNVYYSGIDLCLSNIGDPSSWADEMAFPTFLDWLAFYLEKVVD